MIYEAPKRLVGRVILNGRIVDVSDVTTLAHGDIERISNEAKSGVAPLKKIPTYREQAKLLRLPDGPMAGQAYDPSLDPVHDAVVTNLEKGWNRHVWVGAVQSGKSLLMTLVLSRTVTFACQPAVYSQPTLPKIHEAWSGKILPVFDASELSEWLPQTGVGSQRGQTPRFQTFRRPTTGTRAGILYFLAGGGKSEAAQAAVTAPTILIDEVDSYVSRHRIELISKRADAYGSRATRVYTSTVKLDQGSIILGLYSDSTESRLWFACPHCSTWQPLEWENIRYNGEDELAAMASAKYACPACASLWDENDRLHALSDYRIVHKGQSVQKDGQVVGEGPKTTTFGLLWTALDSTIRDISTVVIEHYRAQRALDRGDHGPMRSFFRDQLCRMYTGEMEEIEAAGPLTWEYLHNRTNVSRFGPVQTLTDRDPSDPENYTFSRRVAPPPEDAVWSIGAVDVQHNRVYWLLRAFNKIGTSWIYAWGYEYARRDRGTADDNETRLVLDRTYNVIKGYVGGTDLILCGLDTGDNTEKLKDWVKFNASIWRSMKGMIHSMATKPGDIDGLAWWRDGLLLFQADNARDLFHSTLRRPASADGASVFPSGVGKQDSTIFRHMVSEQSGIDPDTKKKIMIHGPGRNDWLDCAKMTQVLMVGHLVLLRDKTRREDAKISAKAPPPPLDKDGPTVDKPIPPEPEEKPVSISNPLATQRNTKTPIERGRSLSRIQRRYTRY